MSLAQFIRVCRWSKLVYMDMCKRRGSSPLFTRSAPQHGGEPQLFRQFVCATNSDKLSDSPYVGGREMRIRPRRTVMMARVSSAS
jgi:hypothetical protein